MSNEALKRVERAISEIKKGHMIIMMDDEDRENEGDWFMPQLFLPLNL